MVRGHLLSFLPSICSAAVHGESFHHLLDLSFYYSQVTTSHVIKAGRYNRDIFCTLGLGCEDVYNASDRALPVSLRRMQNLFVYKHVRP